MKEGGRGALEDLGSDEEVSQCQEVKLGGRGWQGLGRAFNYGRGFMANQRGPSMWLVIINIIIHQPCPCPIDWHACFMALSKKAAIMLLGLCLTSSVNFPQQMNPHQTFTGLNLIPECNAAHRKEEELALPPLQILNKGIQGNWLLAKCSIHVVPWLNPLFRFGSSYCSTTKPLFLK